MTRVWVAQREAQPTTRMYLSLLFFIVSLQNKKSNNNNKNGGL